MGSKKLDVHDELCCDAGKLDGGVVLPSALSLRANFSWTFSGNVLYAATQWVLLVLIARLGSQVDVGTFALATAVSAPITAFANLKLRAVQASDALDDFDFGAYLAVRLITAFAALGVIAVISYLVEFDGSVRFVILAIGVGKTIESISDVFYGLQQKYEHMDVIAKSLMIKGAASLFAFTTGWLVGGGLLGGVIGLACAWLATLLVYDIPRARSVSRAADLAPAWHWPAMRELTVLALPLGITVAIGSVSTNIPRYIIEHQLSTADLGLFASVSYVLVAGSLIISAIGQSATPRLARLYRTGNASAHLSLTLRLLAIGGMIGLVGVAISLMIGDAVLGLVYGTDYATSGDLLVWLMASNAVTFAYVFLGTALTSMKKFHVQLPVHALGLLVLLVSCWWLVPRYQLHGAAWAMLGSNVIQACAYFILFFVYFAQPSEEKPSA